MTRRWFNDPALYMLITQLFGLVAWLHILRGNATSAFMSLGSGLLMALVGLCYAVMQRGQA
jgi:hypothetical protein